MPTVLCVSHEWNLGFSGLRALAESGFAVVTADDGYQALQCIAAGHVDAMVVNSNLPDIAVDELARYVKLHQPGTPVVMLSSGLRASVKPPREVDAAIPKTRAGRQLAPVLRALLKSCPVHEIRPALEVQMAAPAIG